jgi:hypothetical protein
MRIAMPTPAQLLKAASEPVPPHTEIWEEGAALHDVFLDCGYVHPIRPAVFEAGVHVGLRLAKMILDDGNRRDSIARGFPAGN